MSNNLLATDEIAIPSQPKRRKRYSLAAAALPFVDQLPSHWRVRKLKHVAAVRFSSVDKKSEEGEIPVRLCNYTDVYYRDCITPEIDFMEATADQSEIDRFTLRRGDVLVTKDSEIWSDIAVPAYVAQDLPGVLCGYHLAHIRPNPNELDGSFLSRAFAARGIREQFHIAANGITRYGLPNRAIAGALFPVPPLEEQRAIAAFLDRETAKIDELIAKKTTLLASLRASLSSLRSKAITSGIVNPSQTRSTGHPFLSKVPRHWQTKRLRFCMRSIEQGWSPQCEGRQAEENEWGVLKVGCVNGDAFDSTENKALPADLEPIPKYEIHKGDILMSRANTRELLGSASLVRDVRPMLMLCDKLYRLRVNEDMLDPEFLVEFFATASCRFQFERDADGTSGSMKNIGQDTIKNVWVPIPPLREQQEIVTYLRKIQARFASLVATVEIAKDRLKALRSALISAAVTGQIDVRHWREEAPCQ